MASFVKHFTQNHENIIFIIFQFQSPKVSQEGCFKTHIYDTRPCTGCSTKEAIEGFFY